MSATFEKRTDGSNRRQVRVQKELQEKRKFRIITITVVAVLAVLFIGALFVNSKFIRRNLPAISIGGERFSAAEFDYFYNNAYLEYSQMIQSNYPDLAYLLPTGKPFSSQINQMTGEPWSKTFESMAIENITGLARLHKAAMAAGFVLSDEKRQALEDSIESLMAQSAMLSFPSFEAFLHAYYGVNINEKVFRRVFEYIYIASEYSQYVYDSFKYNEAELTDYYSENSDSLDIFTYRYFMVTADSVAEDDYDTTEEYDAAKEAAKASASENAVKILAGIEDEDGFISAAREYNEVTFDNPDSTLINYPGSWISGDYASWLKEAGRLYGDVTTVDTSTGTYIVFFVDRDNNEYRMPEMRQILILRESIDPDDYDEGEDDPAYQEAVENAEIEAGDRAENVLKLFTEGGGTEEYLLELMPDYSDDTTNGGFYDEISKDVSHRKMIKEIENWLFDPVREYGDFEMIRSEAYGYHLVFFMGHGERYCDYAAEQGLRGRDYSAWEDGLDQGDAVTHWAYKLTLQ